MIRLIPPCPRINVVPQSHEYSINNMKTH
jgi:hypothetical protein